MKSVLAQRLRAARTAINPPITQRDVAKRMDRSPSAINLWESGKTEPSASDLAVLSTWYQVSSDWLLGVNDDTKPLIRISGAHDALPLHTVSVVPPSALVRWHWENALEILQTAVAYPPNTAAAILVSSDALTSTCPTGCYAVVSKAHPMQPGSIVLACVSKASEPVLRRYIREGGDEMLIADDMRFPTYRLDDGVKIIGKVTEVTIRRTLA